MKDKTAAEEITQEVFFRLWINHKILNPKMSCDSYLYSIARNIVINNFRKFEVEKKYYDEMLQNPVKEDDPGDKMDFLELQKLIAQAIDTMPPQQQLVFRLSREEGLLNEKIAQKLNISKRTVEKHISNSLKILRKLIEDRYSLFFM
jgi:RNA polymerase sigma-70 factor (ECF subfamily)